MMTVTDGYCYISDVTIYNNKQNWDNVNIRIGDQNATNPEDEWWPWAGYNEYWDESEWGWFKDDEMKMPRWFDGADPDTGDYIETLVHELGHYIFGFYDEYATGGHDVLENTLMDNKRWYMSYKKLYDDNENPDTEQMDERGMSCWEWFFDQMGNDKVLIDFDEEARQDGYIPYAAWEEVEPGHPPVLINYDFSDHLYWSGADTYNEILEDLEQNERPYFDITNSMNFAVV